MSHWSAILATAQANVDTAHEALVKARADRASIVATAHASGETIYGMAKALGLTQGAVRKILGLGATRRPAEDA